MAAASSKAEYVADVDEVTGIVRCSICMEIFRHPKLLPCSHTFCLDCLEKSGQEAKKLLCALCRQEYALPTDGLKTLPNNIFIDSILGLVKKVKVMTQHKELYCDRCCADTEAICHCMECDKNLCELCRGMTKLPSEVRNSANSASVTKCEEIEDCTHKLHLPFIQGNKCERHEDNELELYCSDCKETLCKKCSQVKHAGHTVNGVEESSESLKTKLKENIKITEYITSATRELALLDEHKEKLVKVAVEAEDKIEEKYDELRRTIEKHRRSLLAELETLKEKRMKKLDVRREKVKLRLKTLEGFVKYSEELADKRPAYAVCRYTHGVLECALEMEKSQDNFEIEQLGPVDIVLLPYELSEVSAETASPTNLIGRIALNEAKDADLRAPIYTRIWKSTLFHGYRGALFNAKGSDQFDILNLMFSMPFDFEELNTYENNILHSTASNAEATLMSAVIKQLKEKGANFTKMINERNGYRIDEGVIYLVRGKDRGRAAWHYVEVNRDMMTIFLKKTNGGTVDVANFGRIILSGWGKDPDEATKEKISKLSGTVPNIAERDQTPLHMAVLKNKTQVARILVENGADVNIVDKFGLTALHIAAMRGNVELVELLLNKGANTRPLNVWNRTALDVAQVNGQDEIVTKIMPCYIRDQTLDFIEAMQRSHRPAPSELELD